MHVRSVTTYRIGQRQDAGDEPMRMVLDANDGDARLIVAVLALQARSNGGRPNVAVMLLHQAQHTVVDRIVAQRQAANGFRLVLGHHLDDNVAGGGFFRVLMIIFIQSGALLSKLFRWLTEISREP